jgi:hypothetical protein
VPSVGGKYFLSIVGPTLSRGADNSLVNFPLREERYTHGEISVEYSH